MPIAACLLWLAWATFTQNTRAWQLCLVALAASGLIVVIRHTDLGVWTWIWLGLIGTLTVFWMRPVTRAWFGMN